MARLLGTKLTKKQRLTLSASHADPRDEFVLTLNAAGYSIRSLATKLGVSQATIHSHRRPAGDKLARTIPTELAARVAKLTGWPPKAWPAGLRA